VAAWGLKPTTSEKAFGAHWVGFTVVAVRRGSEGHLGRVCFELREIGLVWIAASPGEPRPGRSIQPQALEIDGLGEVPGPGKIHSLQSK